MMTHDDNPGEFTLKQARVGILGLGLMGGSLALALRGQVAEILAIERQIDIRQTALYEGIVDLALEELTPAGPPIDFLVLATPVRAILGTLAGLPETRPGGCLVLDLGSTKRAVVAAMDALPAEFGAIGGHPMCGKETAGLASARADLYRGQTFIICPSYRTTPATQAATLAVINAVGARPTLLDATSHDKIVAIVSHLPALVAAALMRVATDEQFWAISASGFHDTSRLAGSDPRMMLDILMTNREAVLHALDGYDVELAAVREALAQGDEAALSEWLATAQVGYAGYRRFKSAEHLLRVQSTPPE